MYTAILECDDFGVAWVVQCFRFRLDVITDLHSQIGSSFGSIARALEGLSKRRQSIWIEPTEDFLRPVESPTRRRVELIWQMERKNG
jgi:hypothetical protein